VTSAAALAVIALTVIGVVGWHVTETEHSWWRQPLFWGFSDRRHAFSFLSYWPACGWIVWREAGLPWTSAHSALTYGAALAIRAIVWAAGKRFAGKDWDWIGVQFYHAVKRRKL
jgi:hypothetical protein